MAFECPVAPAAPNLSVARDGLRNNLPSCAGSAGIYGPPSGGGGSLRGTMGPPAGMHGNPCGNLWVLFGARCVPLWGSISPPAGIYLFASGIYRFPKRIHEFPRGNLWIPPAGIHAAP